MATVSCDIVSAEEQIFTGDIDMLVAAGTEGDLGITHGHAPLLTSLQPGPIRLIKEGDEEDVYYISGGYLEVQPHKVIVLADTALREGDMDEASAEKAKQEAEQNIANADGDFDYSAAALQLAEASAQLRTLRAIKKKLGK